MRKKKILIVDDEKLIRWSLGEKLSEWKLEVVDAEDGKSALQLAEEETPDLVMLDVKLPDKKGTDVLKEFKKKWPGLPVIMITAFGVIDDAVTAMRRGAYDFITKPIDYTKLQSTIKNALEAASLKKEIAFYKEKEKKRFDLSQIVASSEKMHDVLEMVKKIAESETSIILLQGESGTGKDLLAQAIHHLSRRKKAPYLAINCSAIPENLLESELFGYEKGAFTDAKQQKKGLVELADEGTLFLDEISTLNTNLQAKLLRFLENHTFKRVGGLKDIEVDIRVIVATNQDLEEASLEGKFRKDLFYRLNVCPVYIPPLRERKDDIKVLAKHFISQYNLKFRKNIKGLQKDAQKLFFEYEWPGNVRELKNALERAMIFEENSFISTQYLPIRLNGSSSFQKRSFEEFPEKDLSLPGMEKKLLIKALKKTNGNKTRAARLLKITRDTLRYKIKKFNIKPEEYISHEKPAAFFPQ
ncbi:MAG: sigma-54-dependent Fis family transcriptional regulator [Candidatus Aminicenantes bacterium]|nr:sigma-54-dependent Fis family transcriptional regulator [Candidatus Aminicenantes bacterium]